jgi:predicted  nucleic acid-binding Zn-ribbon protein
MHQYYFDMDNKTFLFDLKDEIDHARDEIAQLKGQRKTLMSQLKEQFNCSSIEEAQKKLTNLQTNIRTLEIELDKGCKELEEKYNL